MLEKYSGERVSRTIAERLRARYEAGDDNGGNTAGAAPRDIGQGVAEHAWAQHDSVEGAVVVKRCHLAPT